MDARRFKALAQQARLLTGDYGTGYGLGLRRLYHGDKFGNPGDHEKRMSFGLGGDSRTELGRGYRDGFLGCDPVPRMGRPPLPPGERKANRSVRLSDAHWAKLRLLGVDWLERAIDRAKAPAETLGKKP